MSHPNNLKEIIQQKVDEVYEDLILIRRHLHAHPELSFEEKNTADFVAAELTKIGIPFKKNVGGFGIVGLIEGRNPNNNCLALRADMDALPIQEENDVTYKSQNNGVMHACGHDVHTTCLIGAAKVLWQLKENIDGCIKLIFQPGEEKSPGGASLMIKDGVLENPTVNRIMALHVFPEQASGTVGFRQGHYMASSDEINIKIIGKGGHAALPHLTIDPIHIAALFISNIQVLLSRKNDTHNPSVLSFGSIHGGNTNNVIPSEVELKGTLRTFNEQWRAEAINLIKTSLEQLCNVYNAHFQLDIPPGYPSLYNDPIFHNQVVASTIELLGEEEVTQLSPRMTAEDFSFYAAKVPACFFRLGTNKNNVKYLYPVHHPQFDIDEESMKTGVKVLVWNALLSSKS